MNDYPLRTAEQLPILLQALRKQSGLTQSEAAVRLGVTQQTYSTMERNAQNVGVSRLLKMLGILGVELVLSKPASAADSPAAARGPDPGDKPVW